MASPSALLETAWQFQALPAAQHSGSAQHSTAQHSTAQHSTAQHSTAQHSTAQHSRMQQPTKPDKTCWTQTDNMMLHMLWICF